MMIAGDLLAMLTGGIFHSAYLATPPVEAERTTVLDLKLRPKVIALLEKYGKEVTFTVSPEPTYDATTGKNTAGSPTLYVKKVSPPEPCKIEFVAGELTQVGDIEVILGAKDLPFTPVLTMPVTIDGVVWKIVAVRPMYSGELIAAYTLHLRK